MLWPVQRNWNITGSITQAGWKTAWRNNNICAIPFRRYSLSGDNSTVFLLVNIKMTNTEPCPGAESVACLAARCRRELPGTGLRLRRISLSCQRRLWCHHYLRLCFIRSDSLRKKPPQVVVFVPRSARWKLRDPPSCAFLQWPKELTGIRFLTFWKNPLTFVPQFV